MRAIVIMLITTIVPAAVYAGDGEATPIPWATIVTLGMVIVTAIAGGLLGKMRAVLKSSYEAMKIVSDALEDEAISDVELKQILLAYTNCTQSYKQLIKQIGDLFKKSHKV